MLVWAAKRNPCQACDFAKSMGVRAKTDQVDARTLHAFADVMARHAQGERCITPMLDKARAQLAGRAAHRTGTIGLTLKTVAKQSLEATATGIAAWPRGGQLYPPPRGQASIPVSAPQLQR